MKILKLLIHLNQVLMKYIQNSYTSTQNLQKCPRGLPSKIKLAVIKRIPSFAISNFNPFTCNKIILQEMSVCNNDRISLTLYNTRLFIEGLYNMFNTVISLYSHQRSPLTINLRQKETDTLSASPSAVTNQNMQRIFKFPTRRLVHT